MFYVTDFDTDFDFGMKKIDNFIKEYGENFSKNEKSKSNSNTCSTSTHKCKCEDCYLNIGYYNNMLVFEIPMIGIKKENITVKLIGNIIYISATYVKDVDINYYVKRLKLSNINKEIKLVDNYIGGNVKWKYSDGLLTITVSKYQQNNSDTIEPSEGENFFGDSNEESTNGAGTNTTDNSNPNAEQNIP